MKNFALSRYSRITLMFCSNLGDFTREKQANEPDTLYISNPERRNFLPLYIFYKFVHTCKTCTVF